MFNAEAIGSSAFQEVCPGLMQLPQILATGYLSEYEHDQGAWCLLEFLNVSNIFAEKSDIHNCQFAQVLAKMHKISEKHQSQSSHSGLYGFNINTFNMCTEQDNTWRNDWSVFFIEQRLKPIVQKMKTDPNLIVDHSKNMEFIFLCERLIPYVPQILELNRIQIRPCLLHGNLSDKNWFVDKEDCVILFDASPFYGPYEVDISVMSIEFIQAYFKAIGGSIEGYEMRFELYNVVRMLRLIIDLKLDKWRTFAFESLEKLLINCGAWLSPLLRFPCGIKIPTNKLIISSSTADTMNKNKNVILLYAGSFFPVHCSHLEVINFVAERLENPPYNFQILGGYFCPGSESWIKQKQPEKHLPDVYREGLLLLATEGTRWMVIRSYHWVDEYPKYIIEKFHNIYGNSFDFKIIYIGGIDNLRSIDPEVPIQYTLAIVDRPGFDGEGLWNEYLRTATSENKKRLIWLAPWTGGIRSSTNIRCLLSKVKYNSNENIRRCLENSLPLSCIDYIIEYKLQHWFNTPDVI